MTQRADESVLGEASRWIAQVVEAASLTIRGKRREGIEPLSGPGKLVVGIGIYLLAVIVVNTAKALWPDSSRSTVAASPAVAESRRDPRREDSTRLAILLSGPMLGAELIEADRLVRTLAAPALPDSLHRRLVSLRLDSADAYLKPGPDGVGATTPAKQHLDAVRPPLSDAQQARLTKLRSEWISQDRRTTALSKKLAAKYMVQQRKQFAAKLENDYLDQGLDITVSATGSQSTVLRLKWILVSRVMAHQFSKNAELFANLRDAGFSRLVITDGYDETWYWDIK
jgi:hypothetical protein